VVDPSMSVKRKVTVPVGRLGKRASEICKNGVAYIRGDVRRGNCPLLGC